MTLVSPYPYFGGKSKVADEIWRRFGDVSNYIEPFFGSGAVLLARPHTPDLELVNDVDGYIVNFWRAVQADADTVASYADYPAFESDLHARHAWLVQRKDDLQARLEGDPDYYDAKIAGWWVWGMSLWIGSGFCSGRGSWVSVDGKLVNAKAEASAVAGQLPKVVDRNLRADYVRDYAAIGRQLPRVSGVGVQRAEYADAGIVRRSPRLTAWQSVNTAKTGRGVARQLPYLSRPLGGVKRNRIELAGSPKGVQRKLLETVSARGEHRAHRGGLYAYMRDLQTRFARVRVTCGDWTRVVTPAVLTAKTPTAVLLDPPYTHEGREAGLYVSDEAHVHVAAREWAIANGNNPDYRIAYCGYDNDCTFPDGWTRLNWKANGGYSNQGTERRENALREVVWFSPHCLQVEQQLSMFEAVKP